MKRPVTFIKLGGAMITDKSTPETLRHDELTRLTGEIARAYRETGAQYVVGNGAGSFAHVPASRYKTMEGFVSEESRLGMAITQDAAARLNRIVVESLLAHAVPAVTLAPSNTVVCTKKRAMRSCLDVFEEYLRQGLVPVVYGDVLVDHAQGCTIWSTDTVFSFLARELEKQGTDVDRIIHVTEADGVWKDSVTHATYDTITPAMRDEVKQNMVDTKGFDVTGGMWHKIEESLSLTKLGIETRILSGMTKDALYETLVGRAQRGTVICRARRQHIERSRARLELS